MGCLLSVLYGVLRFFGHNTEESTEDTVPSERFNIGNENQHESQSDASTGKNEDEHERSSENATTLNSNGKFNSDSGEDLAKFNFGTINYFINGNQNTIIHGGNHSASSQHANQIGHNQIGDVLNSDRCSTQTCDFNQQELELLILIKNLLSEKKIQTKSKDE